MSKPVDDVVRILRAPVEMFAGLLKEPVATTSRIAGRTAVEIHSVATLLRAGMVGPEPPWRLAEIAKAVIDRGAMASAMSVQAMRHGDRVALVDERGSLTYAELDRRAEVLAAEWHRRGVGAGSGVGIFCRNHRGFLDAILACMKLGARALLLNTDFSAPQATEVCRAEGVEVLVADEEFTHIAAPVAAPRGRFTAWSDSPPRDGDLEAIIARGEPAELPRPERDFSVVILTSGTTGTPRGANRATISSLSGPGALLSRIPFRSGGTVYVAQPMFHAWGLATTAIALALGSTVVTSRRFDPAAVWEALESRRCTALVLVPVMLARLLAHDEAASRHPALTDLRIVAVSGSQLDAHLATRALQRFGPVVHNLYGSTEVACATIATPDDLAAAPGCAGRPPFGITVKVLGADAAEVPAGQTGHIFVGNDDQFSGYTGGGGKQVVDGLMSTGDVGHLDADGRLWIDGRADEMIVSGGENVFPSEVESLLAAHPAVSEAAVVGVDDEEFGQRLRAFVVLHDGAELEASALRRYVRENLARYKVPRDVVFVPVLPRNASGKILKRDLVGAG